MNKREDYACGCEGGWVREKEERGRRRENEK
jgi:hypothetical protein